MHSFALYSTMLYWHGLRALHWLNNFRHGCAHSELQWNNCYPYQFEHRLLIIQLWLNQICFRSLFFQQHQFHMIIAIFDFRDLEDLKKNDMLLTGFVLKVLFEGFAKSCYFKKVDNYPKMYLLWGIRLPQPTQRQVFIHIGNSLILIHTLI